MSSIPFIGWAAKAALSGQALQVHSLWVVFWALPVLSPRSKIAKRIIQDSRYSSKHAGIKGWGKTRMQYEKNKGQQGAG